jgi:hypothetical protein
LIVDGSRDAVLAKHSGRIFESLARETQHRLPAHQPAGVVGRHGGELMPAAL